MECLPRWSEQKVLFTSFSVLTSERAMLYQKSSALLSKLLSATGYLVCHRPHCVVEFITRPHQSSLSKPISKKGANPSNIRPTKSKAYHGSYQGKAAILAPPDCIAVASTDLWNNRQVFFGIVYSQTRSRQLGELFIVESLLATYQCIECLKCYCVLAATAFLIS